MGAIAAILIGGGIVALIVGGYLRFKGGRIEKAPLVPTGDAARGAGAANGRVSVEGRVACAPPLLSPVTQTPCVYYELKVIGSWKDGDATKTKDYVHEKVAAPFSVDDGSGPVAIDASQGGDMDMKKSFDETKKEGFLADFKNAVGKGAPMMFGHYAFVNPPLSKATRSNASSGSCPCRRRRSRSVLSRTARSRRTACSG